VVPAVPAVPGVLKCLPAGYFVCWLGCTNRFSNSIYLSLLSFIAYAYITFTILSK
jgi:hypothetical protein